MIENMSDQKQGTSTNHSVINNMVESIIKSQMQKEISSFQKDKKPT